MTDPVRIILNGEPRNIAARATLASLLVELKLTPDKVAIELNRRLVRAERYGETMLKEDDQVEVVTFVGGG